MTTTPTAQAPSAAPSSHTDAIRPDYRLYVDEVGNVGMKPSADPQHNFLSLTGVIIHREHVRDVLNPVFADIKRRYARCDPDQPVVFHRKDLMQSLYPFRGLLEPEIRAAFDAELLRVLEDLEFEVITVVIDKAAHVERYGDWAHHPYHYCLQVLVERYAMHLNGVGAKGDVMAEARGKKEDAALAEVFRFAFEHGTVKLSNVDHQRALTSRELKIKRKTDNISGLQLADIVAHPSLKAMQHRREGKAMKEDFSAKVADILERKKYRRMYGKIDGFGRKWLP